MALTSRINGFSRKELLADVEHGRANNVTLLRVVLASSVILSHAYPITGCMKFEPMVLFSRSGASLGDVAVIGFFFLSGYLIFKSALRHVNPMVFLRARFLRIFPGLAVAVMLSVFLIGARFTSLSVWAYFSDPNTYRYLLTIVLYHQAGLNLPGLFQNNIIQEANLPLWTLSSEWTMYMLALLAGIGVHRRIVLREMSWRSWLAVGVVTLLTAQMFPLPWKYTLHWALAFLLGAATYLSRRWVILSLPIAVSLFLLDLLLVRYVALPGKVLFPFAFCYLLLVFSFHSSVRVSSFLAVGDFSYGLYIYGWPIEQIVSSHIHTPLSLFFISYILALLLAVVSWFAIESPSLRLR